VRCACAPCVCSGAQVMVRVTRRHWPFEPPHRARARPRRLGLRRAPQRLPRDPVSRQLLAALRRRLERAQLAHAAARSRSADGVVAEALAGARVKVESDPRMALLRHYTTSLPALLAPPTFLHATATGHWRNMAAVVSLVPCLLLMQRMLRCLFLL
jgi:hypothetical protein